MTDREYMDWQQQQLARAAEREVQLRAELAAARGLLAMVERRCKQAREERDALQERLDMARRLRRLALDLAAPPRTQEDMDLELHCGVG